MHRIFWCRVSDTYFHCGPLTEGSIGFVHGWAQRLQGSRKESRG